MSMEPPIGHDQNADQIAYWNGPGGQRWADRQQAQDILLKPVADALIDRAKPKAGERIIDVGCGSGATSIAFARKVGPSGHVFGIDISGPMLARARQVRPRSCRSISCWRMRPYIPSIPQALIYWPRGSA